MRTVKLLACVAVVGLFSGFSCAAHSDQGDRADSKAQSGNANSTADDKKVSTSAGGASVEVKSSGDNGSVEVKGSGDSGSVAVKGSGDNGSVVVKGSGEGNNSVTISAGGIAVSETNDSERGDDVVKISGLNQNLSYECEGRSFNVQGTSNTVKLSGQCQSLRVAGTTNQVEVESVASINVSGIRNRVTWERGVNNKRPSISNSGINNNVSQKGN